MQAAMFAATGLLVSVVYTNRTSEMLSANAIVLALLMLVLSFVFHTLFHEYDKNYHVLKTEQQNTYKRSFWIMGLVCALVISDMIAGTSANLTWLIAFLFLAGLQIWEFVFYMITPPSQPFKREPRKSDKGHEQRRRVVQHQGAHPKPHGQRWMKRRR